MIYDVIVSPRILEKIYPRSKKFLKRKTVKGRKPIPKIKMVNHHCSVIKISEVAIRLFYCSIVTLLVSNEVMQQCSNDKILFKNLIEFFYFNNVFRKRFFIRCMIQPEKFCFGITFGYMFQKRKIIVDVQIEMQFF